MSEINIIGCWTLYKKEVRRFLKVYNQTIFAPVITSLLFLAIFNLALGDRVKTIGGVNFGQFVAAGLIMMSVMQNAFANTSSSFTMGKVLGTIVDLLMPPLSAGEITFAMTLAGITRGIMVGILVGVAITFFIPLNIYDFGYLLFSIISASMLLALLGLLGGIFSETFDHMAAVTSYVITPLTFLSGTFYSVKNLPDIWYNVSQFNPFFYLIDGFRYGITGYHDGNLIYGAVFVSACNLILWIASYYLIKKGYRIKQ
ncbi:ABC transporter permease [Rickettsiales bacterium]|nr:ABC transporter permease [Rickettsiales bacterium]